MNTEKAMYRKSLLPLWLKITGFFFFFATIISIIAFFFTQSTSLSISLFGLVHYGGSFSIEMVLIFIICIFHTIGFIGLFFLKDWGPSFLLSIGLILMIYFLSRFFYSISNHLIEIRLEPFLIVLFIWKINSIRREWKKEL